MYAEYFVRRSNRRNPEEVTAIAEEYLSRQEDITHEIREQGHTFVIAQHIYWPHAPKSIRFPQILFAPDNLNALREAGDSALQVLEAGMQALIEGNRDNLDALGNLYGVNEAYAVAHEYAHYIARVFPSGRVLDHLSEITQGLLGYLATFNLSPEKIAEVWTLVWENNKNIQLLAQKFEPVEEIFATYVGLRFSPIEVRNAVTPLIKVGLEKRGWDEAYESFAELCESFTQPLEQAHLICEYVFRMMGVADLEAIDSVKLLCAFIEIHNLIWSYFYTSLDIMGKLKLINDDGLMVPKSDFLEIEAIAEKGAAKQINRILEQAHIPQDIYWTVSAIMREEVGPARMRLHEAFINNSLSDLSDEERQELRHPTRITLIGSPATKTVAICTYYHDCQIHVAPVPPFARIFYESMRQQLSRRSGKKRVKIVCPFACLDKGECCGYNEKLRRLHEHLPEEDRRRFTLPDCARNL